MSVLHFKINFPIYYTSTCYKVSIYIFICFQDNGASPRATTAFLNISVTDENDNSAAFVSTNCQTDSRGFCVGARYAASAVSGSVSLLSSS